MYVHGCVRSSIYTANVQLFSECGKFFMLNVVDEMLIIINITHHLLTILCTLALSHLILI